VGSFQVGGLGVDLGAVALDQLLAGKAPDRVGDGRAEHVADHPGEDDPDQGEMMLIDVEPREQHRQLGAGHRDHAADPNEQADPGVAEAADDVGGDGDEHAAHRGLGEEHQPAA
jgi:hypothetical protein